MIIFIQPTLSNKIFLSDDESRQLKLDPRNEQMKYIALAAILLLSACTSYKKGEIPMMYDPETDEMRPCGHIGMLGDCKHYM